MAVAPDAMRVLPAPSPLLAAARYTVAVVSPGAGGPSSDGDLGIIVFGHTSRDEVDEILRHEPFISAGLRHCEVIDWEVHHVLGIGGFDTTTIAAMFGPPRNGSGASPTG